MKVEIRTASAKSDADVARENGWTPGTLLVGDEGYGPTVIKITAVGEEHVLAKPISHNGKATPYGENIWTLSYRDWERIN
jgi:hypothetical protein